MLEFTSFRFVYILPDYLQKLHEVDSEIFFTNESDYGKKPHLGILTNCNGTEYVIPLTSAKPKHASWRDVTATNYRIYEEIDIRTAVVDRFDIIVDETDYNKLRGKGIPEDEFFHYKKRILSVLEIKKMFPVVNGVYELVDLSNQSVIQEDEQRRNLMLKEYFFCKRIDDTIQKKAQKIYEKQMATGVVAPYHCNFKVLEEAAGTYERAN